MYGSRDTKSQLWRVDLKHKMTPKISQCNHAHDNNNHMQSCQVHLDQRHLKRKFLIMARIE
jgi:hypothetical protein